MTPAGTSWRQRLGLERDFRDRREMVERSRSAAWRVPIALIVATVGAGALGYLGVQLFLLPETLAESRLHRVPDLTGMRIEDAGREGGTQGYELVASGSQYSDEIDEGDVIYQIPPPGSYLAQGDTVYALVSLGPQETLVPDLAGLDVEQARAVLNQLGVRVAGIRREASELLPQNAVVGSVPAAGTPVAEEMEVVLRLSRGGAIVEMPDVRGLSQAAARDTLEIFGLTVGEVTELAVADSGDAGGRPVVVTGQEPGPRRPVPTGSAVRLVLGLAPEAPRQPGPGAGRPTPPAAVPEDVTAAETPENEAARGEPLPADPGPPPDEEPAPDPVSPDDEEF